MKIKEEIASALIEATTFDLLASQDEWPTIHYLIANHVLRHCSEYERFNRLNGKVKEIRVNLASAIKHLEENLGKKVFRGITEEGEGKNIEFITLDANYRDAKQTEYSRLMNRYKHTTIAIVEQVAHRLPPSKEAKMINEGIKLLEGFRQDEAQG